MSLKYFVYQLLPLANFLLTAQALPHDNDLKARKGATDEFGDYTGSKASYPDGSGTYARTGDVWTYATGVKCWTDVFVHDTFDVAYGWAASGTQVDCKTTSSCQSHKLEAHQTCETWANTAVPGGMLTGSWEKELPVVGKTQLSATASFQDWIMKGGQTCTTVQTDATCTWSDGKCHALWVSDVFVRTSGYIRRRCNYGKGKGDETVWSHDYNLDYPTSTTRVGCAASCSDNSYPGKSPPPPDQVNIAVY